MIKDILESYIKEDIKEIKEHKDRLYPAHSSCYITFNKYKRLYGKCMRAAYYSCMGYSEEEADKTISSEFKKYIGRYVENMIINVLRKKDALVDKSVKFNIEKYKISGEIDGIVKIDDKEYGLEIKSIGGNNQYINNLVFINELPKWQNLFQTLIYCYAFKDKLPNGFILFYIRRDTCEIKEFKVQVEPYNGKLIPVINGKPDHRYTINDILERYSILYKYIKADMIPPKEYMQIYPSELIPKFYASGILSKKQVDAYNIKAFGDTECKFCGYKERCEKDK